MKKRLLATLLCILMIVGMLPTAALAAESTEPVYTSAGIGELDGGKVDTVYYGGKPWYVLSTSSDADGNAQTTNDVGLLLLSQYAYSYRIPWMGYQSGAATAGYLASDIRGYLSGKKAAVDGVSSADTFTSFRVMAAYGDTATNRRFAYYTRQTVDNSAPPVEGTPYYVKGSTPSYRGPVTFSSADLFNAVANENDLYTVAGDVYTPTTTWTESTTQYYYDATPYVKVTVSSGFDKNTTYYTFKKVGASTTSSLTNSQMYYYAGYMVTPLGNTGSDYSGDAFLSGESTANHTFASDLRLNSADLNAILPTSNGTDLDCDIFFLLSQTEAQNSEYGLGSQTQRKTTYWGNGTSTTTVSNWWLRSVKTYGNQIRYVDQNGSTSNTYPANGTAAGIRPAFNLKPSQVEFISAVDETGYGKAALGTEFQVLASTNTNTYKLTLKDSAISPPTCNLLRKNSDGSYSVYWSGGLSEGGYVSAIITDASGNIYGYRKLGTTETGSATFTLNNGITELGNGYTLKIFNEKCSDSDTGTDYISALTPCTVSNVEFTYTAPSDLTYNGALKTATMTADGVGTITVNHYDANGAYVAEPKNAGDYTVKINVSGGNALGAVDNITDPAWKFTIAKATPTPTTPANLTAIYGQTLADVALDSSGQSGTWAWDNSETSVGAVGDHTFGATFTPNDTDNYNGVQTSLTVTVGQATPAHTVPTGLAATYGQTLANVTLPTGWAWNDAATTSVGNAGDQTFTATFTPDDTTNYKTVQSTLTIAVGKATPEYTAPSGLTAACGQQLKDVALTTGWTWNDPDSYVGNVGNNSFAATFTPTDTGNYNTVSMSLQIEVSKGTPIHEVPTGLTAIYGQTLSNVTLPDGWTWNAPETSVGAVGDNSFAATYTPSDMDNYNTVETNLTVTVVHAGAGVTLGTVPATKTYGDAEFQVSATVATAGDGDGTWVWTSSDPTVLQIVSGNTNTATVKILKVGSATLTVKYESTTTAGMVTSSAIVVDKKNITAPTENDATFTYNGTAQTYLSNGDGYTIDGGVQTNANETGYTVKAVLSDKDNTQWADTQNAEDKVFTFKIMKQEISVAAGEYKVTKVYDGTNTAGTGDNSKLVVTGIQEVDKNTVTVQATPGTYNFTDVNSDARKMNVTLSINGDTNSNYKLANTTLEVPCEITQRDISITGATVTNKTYNGDADATVTAVTIPGASDNLTMGTDFEVTSATFPDADADSSNVDVTINVALKGDAITNYRLTNGTNYVAADAAKIEKAAAPTGIKAEYDVFYGDTTAKTVALSDFNLPSGNGFQGAAFKGDAGSKTDSSNLIGSYSNTSFALASGLTNAVVDQTASWTVTIESTNHADITATVTVKIANVTFSVNNAPATVANALTVKSEPVYGDTWAEIVQFKTGITITASAASNTDTDQSHFTLDVTGKPNAGNEQEYKILYNGEIDGVQYTNVLVLSGKVNVAKKTLTADDLEYSIGSKTKVYDGTTNSDVTVKVKAGSLVNPDDSVTVSGNSAFNSKDVADGTKIIFTTAALTDNNNYALAAGVKVEIEASITKKSITVNVEPATRAYGAVNPPFAGTVDSGTPLATGDNYTGLGMTYQSAATAASDVGNYNVTGSGTDGNYAITVNGTGKLTITKAAAPALTDVPVTQKYTVTSEQFKELGTAGMPADAGALTYNKGTENKTGSVTISSWDVDANGKVTFALTGGADGNTVTLPVKINSTNYAEATVNVVITLTAKDTPTATAEDITVTYTGTAITSDAIVGTASVEGTWSFDGTYDLISANGTGIDVVVKFTPTDSINYTEVTDTIKVIINKATPTGAPEYTKITTSGKKLGDAPLTLGNINVPGVVTWDLGNDTEVKANTSYDWTFRPTDSANYNELTGSFTVWGVYTGDYPVTYAVTVEPSENGTVKTSPLAASAGTTVSLTVTPDEGYNLSTLTVTDKSGKEIELTKKDGKYTFKMPAGKVTVTATFKAVENEPCDGGADCPAHGFADVDTAQWYHEAVDYVIEHGLMTGTNNGFEPMTTTNRAMIVTILYRLEGEPAVSADNPFADVSNGQWYTNAIIWAAENELVGGYGNGQFGPTDDITREQLAAILWRYAKYKGYDVSVGEDTNILSYKDAAQISEWAVSAMQWVIGEGIMQGYDGNLTPVDGSKRCEAAAMLMRFIEGCTK